MAKGMIQAMAAAALFAALVGNAGAAGLEDQKFHEANTQLGIGAAAGPGGSAALAFFREVNSDLGLGDLVQIVSMPDIRFLEANGTLGVGPVGSTLTAGVDQDTARFVEANTELALVGGSLVDVIYGAAG